MVVRFLLNRYKELEFTGPIFSNDSKSLEKFYAFSDAQNKVKAYYLQSEFQRNLESDLELKERSAHFMVTKHGKVVACLRLTPSQFELSRLSQVFSLSSVKYLKYYEISRLNTDHLLPNKALIARLILFKAGLWLFAQTNAKGMIGICKTSKLHYFEKFGMKKIEQDYITERKADYFLIKASKKEILSTVLKQIVERRKVLMKGEINDSRATTIKT